MSDKKSNLYTKTGDLGETSLVGGTRVKKSDHRIELYGMADELNSTIGVAISHMNEDKFSNERNALFKIQSDLFSLGSNLACEVEKREQFKLPQLSDDDIKVMEKDIDSADGELEPLKNFVLPGGSVAASQLHIVRTVCRRLERRMVEFEVQYPGDLPANGMKYINRLSDYAFALARLANHRLNVDEIIWKSN